MGRGPEAASEELVEAAFGHDGDAVCEELVGLLRDADKAAVERAARTLKMISERDAGALYAWRKALLREALRAVDVRVQWNLSIVLGRLPLRDCFGLFFWAWSYASDVVIWRGEKFRLKRGVLNRV